MAIINNLTDREKRALSETLVRVSDAYRRHAQATAELATAATLRDAAFARLQAALEIAGRPVPAQPTALRVVTDAQGLVTEIRTNADA